MRLTPHLRPLWLTAGWIGIHLGQDWTKPLAPGHGRRRGNLQPPLRHLHINKPFSGKSTNSLNVVVGMAFKKQLSRELNRLP